jgi:hypothetical protein
MNSAALTPATKARSTEMARRVESLDWQQIAVDLDAYGCAMAKGVLLGDECGELAALYRQDAPFRSRIAMSRHGFGRGEYKYWAYPLRKPWRRRAMRSVPISLKSPTVGIG